MIIVLKIRISIILDYLIFFISTQAALAASGMSPRKFTVVFGY